jgi:hypothetical protein
MEQPVWSKSLDTASFSRSLIQPSSNACTSLRAQSQGDALLQVFSLQQLMLLKEDNRASGVAEQCRHCTVP